MNLKHELGTVLECINNANIKGVEVGSRWFVDSYKEGNGCFGKKEYYNLKPYIVYGELMRIDYHTLTIDEKSIDKLFKVVHEEDEKATEETVMDEFQKGLNTIWTALRKYKTIPQSFMVDVFKMASLAGVIDKYEPEEFLKKMKQYEEEQIRIGDIVKGRNFERAVVLIDYEISVDLWTCDGEFVHKIEKHLLTKTGEDAKEELKALFAKIVVPTAKGEDA